MTLGHANASWQVQPKPEVERCPAKINRTGLENDDMPEDSRTDNPHKPDGRRCQDNGALCRDSC